MCVCECVGISDDCAVLSLQPFEIGVQSRGKGIGGNESCPLRTSLDANVASQGPVFITDNEPELLQLMEKNIQVR